MSESARKSNPKAIPVRAAPRSTGRKPAKLQRPPTCEELEDALRRLPESRNELIELSERLPESDEVPLESPWHFAAICLLIDVLTYVWRDREDFYVGGNMFLYFSPRQLKNEDFKGPDFFYISGVVRRTPKARRAWVKWLEENKLPDMIMEHTSPSTAKHDRTVKKKLYEQTLRVPEYFIYDPKKHLLEGWRLHDKRYRKIKPDKRGWLWSETLGLWLGNWEGKYLGEHGIWPRPYDAEGRLVLIQSEDEQRKAEAERQRAEVEQKRADVQRQRAEAEQQRAEAERQRADAGDAEIARLKALLAEKGIVT